MTRKCFHLWPIVPLALVIVLGALWLGGQRVAHSQDGDGARCRGDDPGVQLVPDPECPWSDAGQFSAWVSLAHENGYHETDTFENGTTLCAWDCCLKIVCPGAESAAPAESSDGFTSIISTLGQIEGTFYDTCVPWAMILPVYGASRKLRHRR